MSADEEKKFVIKHTFTDVDKFRDNESCDGKQVKHFNTLWSIKVTRYCTIIYIFIKISKLPGDDAWEFDTLIDSKILTKTGEETVLKEYVFSHTERSEKEIVFGGKLEKYLVDGNLSIECDVTIKKMTGIEKPNIRSFEDSNEKYSDVALLVKGKKFHVLKKYLAVHSTYFNSLFNGNFEESKQSEVELKNIDKYHFQKFLEVIYGEPAVHEYEVEGILELADMYDSKTVIRRCEEFLVHRSKHDLKFKFCAAVKYGMEDLKKKCISEMKTSADVKSVLPEDNSQFNSDVWRELMDHCITISNNK